MDSWATSIETVAGVLLSRRRQSQTAASSIDTDSLPHNLSIQENSVEAVAVPRSTPNNTTIRTSTIKDDGGIPPNDDGDGTIQAPPLNFKPARLGDSRSLHHNNNDDNNNNNNNNNGNHHHDHNDHGPKTPPATTSTAQRRSNGNTFAVSSIRRGSDDWRFLVKPFVCDLVFRSMVRRPLQTNPSFQTYTTTRAAVLFIDLSGYSKITTALGHKGAHAISTVVNEYLNRIIQIVHHHGGDVIKFAGDAVLVVWENSPPREKGQGGETNNNNNNNNNNSRQNQENEERHVIALLVLCATRCAIELQQKAGIHPIPDTDLVFRMHCGISCGSLESDIFEAPTTHTMQRLYHSISGDCLREMAYLVDLAKAGEICVSAQCATFLQGYATFQEPAALAESSCSGSGIKLVTALTINDSAELERIESFIFDSMAERMDSRCPRMEEDFIHPAVLQLLSHGGASPTHIAQMRNLCILFIAMTSNGSSVNWLMEVQCVLDQYHCPIVQIIDDDKGVHIVAAVNLYESIPEAGVLGVRACRTLIEKRVGCAIGMAMGQTFCGVTGCSTIACRWDITGPPVVRAARLMQHAMEKRLGVAVDESVYDGGSIVTTLLEVLDTGVVIKGTEKPIEVYSLSQSGIDSAFRILETVHARIHDDIVEKIYEVIATTKRTAVVVTGIPMSGKKIVCQRAAGDASFVPFLHVTHENQGLLQLARTIATWFRYSDIEEVHTLAENVIANMNNSQWSCAHDECIRLVDLALHMGLNACFLVDSAQFLDKFSLSLISECLSDPHRRNEQQNRRRSSNLSSVNGDGPGDDENSGSGRLCFLCVHGNLYNRKTASQLVHDIVRSRKEIDIPIFKVLRADPEDFRVMFRDLTHTEVCDRWLDIQTEAAGYCAGYFIERNVVLRNESAKLWREGKMGYFEISKDLSFTIPPGMARKNRLFRLTRVSSTIAMKFYQIYDELPHLFKMVVKVLAVSNGRGLCNLPRVVLWEVLNDLVQEGVDEDLLSIMIAEMVEMYILQTEDDNGRQLIEFCNPALGDIAFEICTPLQLEKIRDSLLERLAPLMETNFRISLLVADLLNDVGQEEELKKELWRCSNEMFLAESKDWPRRMAEKWHERIRDEIQDAGYQYEDIVPSQFCLLRKPRVVFSNKLILLRSWMAPVAFGPLGPTLNVLTLHVWDEWRLLHGKGVGQSTEQLYDEIESASSRFMREISIVEAFLCAHGVPTNPSDRDSERELIELLAKQAHSIEEAEQKIVRVLDDLVAYAEKRRHQFHELVKSLRRRPDIPDCVKHAEEPIRKAYECLASTRCGAGTCALDAAQHALMVLATMNWKPRPLSEQLGIIHHTSVARLRNKTLKRLTDQELLLFRHRQTVTDLESFLVITALLQECQDQARCSKWLEFDFIC